jgi:predicted ATPase/DNA-binding XRE family transcriptional regulator
VAAIRDSSFGDLLRRLRREAGLTQEELAERAGLSVRGISDLERGINQWPYRATVQRLIEALAPGQADADELWDRAARRRGPRPDQPDAPRPRLPAPTTPILGREREEAMALHLLRREGKRLVTLTGAGGVGKTRLALQVAWVAREDYPDGAAFASLATLTDPDLVPPTLAAALGVRIVGRPRVEDALGAFLAERETLVVLDNLEQVLPAAPFVARLLGECPGLTVLATSREPLRLRGEQEVEIGPLAIPAEGTSGSPEELSRIASVALFLERAASVQPAFALTEGNREAVAEICRRLDGLPLALELAAAQMKYVSPGRLVDQLSYRLEVLRGGARDLPPRQQTMRDTVAWSYDLLQPREQVVFCHLAVFSGGCTEETVSSVLHGTGMTTVELLAALRALVDKSLLRAEAGGETRFTMLETIRDYARERLEANGEAATVRQRHARYFVAVAEE